jgi:uncharacterized protein (TIGR02996 family)
MTADTGAALAAAILADPDDDAPWLVYADWLQEAGRDAEATAVRAHLPALRTAVRNGKDLAHVLLVATLYPPGGPVWNAAFGLSPAPDAPGPAQAAPTPRPAWTSQAAGQRDQPSWGPALFPILYCAVALVRVLAPSSDRHGPDPSPDESRQRLQRIVEQSRAARDTRPGPSAPLARPWGTDVTTGSAARPAGGRSASPPTVLQPSGTAVGTTGWNGPVRWTVEPDGWITLTSTDGSRATRMIRVPVVNSPKGVEKNTDLDIRPKR